jgi:DNA repair exonuclease SbcCD nuclease subunit
MSEIRFVTSSDEHLADNPPGYRKDDYRASIFKKLVYQGVLARKYQANALLRGGDFFHIKAANKTTHSTVSIAARIHQEYSCPTYALAGNHDIVYSDLETISRQPLGVMYNTSVFKNLRDEVFEDDSLKVRVVGIPYTAGLDPDFLRQQVCKLPDDGYVIAFVHALASMAPSEKIQSFFNEPIFDYRDLVFEGCPDAYVFGHYHKDQGIVDHLGVKFVNLGAVSRGALTFENLERKPKVSLIKVNSQGLFIEEHIVPHEDSSQIFDLERKQQIDREMKSLSDFVEQFRLNAAMSKDNDLKSRLNGTDWNLFSDDLKSLAMEIIEAAESGSIVDE